MGKPALPGSALALAGEREQHAFAMQRRRPWRLSRWFRRETDMHGRNRALVQPRFEGDLAAHERDDLLADRQAEPGAAITPRDRIIGLNEFVEEAGRLLRRDADAGILDPEAQGGGVPTVAIEGHADLDEAALGELDRVAGEVE